MSKLIKVDGFPGLVRDPVSGAILNINKNQIDSARKGKAVVRKNQSKIEQLENDISDIKNILLKMLEEKNGSNTN